MKGFKEFVFNESISTEHDVLNMYTDPSGYHVRKISEMTGVSVAGIYRILEKYGMHPQRRRGHIHAHEIVQQYHDAGLPVHKISELTGYSKRNVYNIVKLSRRI